MILRKEKTFISNKIQSGGGFSIMSIMVASSLQAKSKMKQQSTLVVAPALSLQTADRSLAQLFLHIEIDLMKIENDDTISLVWTHITRQKSHIMMSTLNGKDSVDNLIQEAGKLVHYQLSQLLYNLFSISTITSVVQCWTTRSQQMTLK